MDTLEEYIHIVEENRKLKREILELLKTKMVEKHEKQANEYKRLFEARKSFDPTTWQDPESSDEEDESDRYSVLRDMDQFHQLREASIREASNSRGAYPFDEQSSFS